MFTFRHHSGRNRASKHTSFYSLLAERCERFFPFFFLTQRHTNHSIVLKSLPRIHLIRNIYSGTCDKIFSFHRTSYKFLNHQTSNTVTYRLTIFILQVLSLFSDVISSQYVLWHRIRWLWITDLRKVVKMEQS
jgi:predicted butyrate kinase (DUF1464 family)